MDVSLAWFMAGSRDAASPKSTSSFKLHCRFCMGDDDSDDGTEED